MTAAELASLGAERFVSLTTFRRSGERVSTPVWVAREGEALVVTTPATSGKVKRLRNSPRVELRPCGRVGQVTEGVEPLEAAAEIAEDTATLKRVTGLIRRKYGLEYLVVMGLERLGRSSASGRVVLRIRGA